jgi:hypothetical protein
VASCGPLSSSVMLYDFWEMHLSFGLPYIINQCHFKVVH